MRAGNKLVELMHLNARVAKHNLSSSKKRKLSNGNKDGIYFKDTKLRNNSFTNITIPVDYKQLSGYSCDYRNSTNFSVVVTGIFNTEYKVFSTSVVTSNGI